MSTHSVILSRTGFTGGRSLHLDRPPHVQLPESDRTMPRQPYALIAAPVATLLPGRGRAKRLSLRAAIFWIAVLALGGWTVIIIAALGLV